MFLFGFVIDWCESHHRDIEMATEYRKLDLKPVPRTTKALSPEARYWKKFRVHLHESTTFFSLLID
jgi:hypothetical protein